MQGSPFERPPHEAVPTLRSPERHAADQERATASIGYLFWPLALATLLDAGPTPRSPWLRRQARCAAILGAGGLVVVVAVLALPPTLLASGALPFAWTLRLYGVAFVLDAVVLAAVVSLCVVASRRVARGEDVNLRALLPIARKDPARGPGQP